MREKKERKKKWENKEKKSLSVVFFGCVFMGVRINQNGYLFFLLLWITFFFVLLSCFSHNPTPPCSVADAPRPVVKKTKKKRWVGMGFGDVSGGAKRCVSHAGFEAHYFFCCIDNDLV